MLIKRNRGQGQRSIGFVRPSADRSTSRLSLKLFIRARWFDYVVGCRLSRGTWDNNRERRAAIPRSSRSTRTCPLVYSIPRSIAGIAELFLGGHPDQKAGAFTRFRASALCSNPKPQSSRLSPNLSLSPTLVAYLIRCEPAGLAAKGIGDFPTASCLPCLLLLNLVYLLSPGLRISASFSSQHTNA